MIIMFVNYYQRDLESVDHDNIAESLKAVELEGEGGGLSAVAIDSREFLSVVFQ